MDTPELVKKIQELRSEGHSLTQIVERVGYSLTHIKNLIREFGAPKGNGKPDKCMNCEVCNIPLKGNSTKFCSKKCKLDSFLKDKGLRSNYHYQKTKGIERKKMLIEMKGGGCEQCGYNKSLRALTFHHRDPSIKSFHLNLHDLSIKGMDSILEELEKCDLLCFNCHMELHENEMVSMVGLEPTTLPL
jgi:ferredoxin